MTARGLIVAASRSGSGKTTVTLGLLAALKRRGIAIRAAKAGPDYIDPAFHAAASGAASINLDSWAMPPGLLDALTGEAAQTAELLIIEGVMGLFDGVVGAPGRTGSTADLATHLGLPVLLVLDVSGQSQTAAAVVRGLAGHDPGVRIAGVVLNRVGSERHRALVENAIDAVGIPVLGAVPRDAALAMPERHLGLVQAQEHGDLTARLGGLADMAQRPTHRRRRGSGFHIYVSARARGLAARRRRDRGVFPACRRISPERLRCLLAPRRLSGATCRRAGKRPSFPGGAATIWGDPAGARRVRRLHGARRRP